MKIINLFKTYKLKYESVEALKGVSFDLPDTGMIFILGKSGCGKSTLLNVLSGLDSFDGGDVIFKGKSLKNFTAAELDDYRNACCGFVFQEYNLIPELNVGDNIALALSLQGEKNIDAKIAAALKKVDLIGYEKRKITELSGGQKQRVAIARSIVKDPQIIFADEPSGALDSDTGESIFGLLKELSKDKLILVVSHDRESAFKYGDRVIELSNGEVINDTKVGFKTNEKQESYAVRRSKMGLKSALKIGCSNFKYHPIRLIATVFLAMIAFSFLGLALAPAMSDISSITYSTMVKHGLDQSAVTKRFDDNNRGLTAHFSQKEYEEVEEQAGAVLPVVYCDEGIQNSIESDIVYNKLPYAFTSITEDKMRQFGFTVDGSLPSRDGEVAITKYTAEVLMSVGLEFNDEVIKFSDINQLKGKQLIVDGKEYTICGIIDTGFNSQKYAALKSVDVNDNDLISQFYSERSDSAHNVLFVSEDALPIKESFTPVSAKLDGVTLASVTLISQIEYEHAAIISDEDGIYLPFDMADFTSLPIYPTLYELGEEYWVQHSEEYYEKAKARGFDGSIEEYKAYVFYNLTTREGIGFPSIYTTVINENRELFDSFTVSITGSYEMDVTVKGFYLSMERNLYIQADKGTYEMLYNTIGGIYGRVIVSRENIKDFDYFVSYDSGTGVNYRLDNYVADSVFSMAKKINALKSVMTYLSIAFAIFSILLLLNFMLHSVTEKTNTIGILKSLGSSNFNLIKIFIWEGAIVGALIYGLALIGLAALGWFFNVFFSRTSGVVYVAIFGVTPVVALILLGTIALFAAIGCILPIARLSRLKPMEYLNKII